MKEVVIQRLTGRLEAYSDLLVGMGRSISKRNWIPLRTRISQSISGALLAPERVIAKVLDPVVGMASFAL